MCLHCTITNINTWELLSAVKVLNLWSEMKKDQQWLIVCPRVCFCSPPCFPGTVPVRSSSRRSRGRSRRLSAGRSGTAASVCERTTPVPRCLRPGASPSECSPAKQDGGRRSSRFTFSSVYWENNFFFKYIYSWEGWCSVLIDLDHSSLRLISKSTKTLYVQLFKIQHQETVQTNVRKWHKALATLWKGSCCSKLQVSTRRRTCCYGTFPSTPLPLLHTANTHVNIVINRTIYMNVNVWQDFRDFYEYIQSYKQSWPSSSNKESINSRRALNVCSLSADQWHPTANILKRVSSHVRWRWTL